MSWKLFWQIVLLIVIAAVVMTTLKVGLARYKYGHKGMYFKTRPYSHEYPCPHEDVRK